MTAISFLGSWARRLCKTWRNLPLALALLVAPAAGALPVADFALADQHGALHRLDGYRDAAAVVFMVQGNGCPIVRTALPDLTAVRAQFAERNVAFLMINANLQDDRDRIRAEAEEWGIDLPILVDETQAIGRQLQLTRTAETLLLTPPATAGAEWRLAYRGPINDRLSYGRQRAAANEHYLATAIEAVLAGEEPAVAARDAKGCLISFPPDAEAERADQPSASQAASSAHAH